MKNLAEHFEDCMYVPLFTPPTDGVKRPTQLLHVTKIGEGYSFDWSAVKRWTDLAQSVGLHYFEWTHLFTQWGRENTRSAFTITAGELLWEPETGATSATYRNFLSQFLPEFKAFLEREKLLERSFLPRLRRAAQGPLGELPAEARALLKELAPWMKSMDALSEIDFAHETDLPIPVTSFRASVSPRRRSKRGIYYCCSPRGKYVNRLMDTPLSKIRMNGWLFYRFQPKLFLHWGYNYWHRSQTPRAARRLRRKRRRQVAGLALRATRSASTPARTAPSIPSAGKSSPNRCRTTRCSRRSASTPNGKPPASVQGLRGIPKGCGVD